jgi:hypothetical protein
LPPVRVLEKELTRKLSTRSKLRPELRMQRKAVIVVLINMFVPSWPGYSMGFKIKELNILSDVLCWPC